MHFNATCYFDKVKVIHELRHFLPTQEPLVNFIHHNTLHALQDLSFDEALSNAAQIFGYKVYLPLDKFRELFHNGLISDNILKQTIIKYKGENTLSLWEDKLLRQDFAVCNQSRIGIIRNQWKKHYHVDLDWHVYPLLFRLLCNYLDQGIALSQFPIQKKSFLESMRELDKNSFVSLFKTKRARKILADAEHTMEDLLGLLLGSNTALYEQYLYDQQFGHKGWSGMATVIENNQLTLLDPKQISLEELIYFELLLEIDTLDYLLDGNWQSLDKIIDIDLITIHDPVLKLEIFAVLALWQKAFELSYYDQVLFAIGQEKKIAHDIKQKSFQALFCLDDRECSFRRYLENLDTNCETFGLPGFFNLSFFFQASGSKFYSKLAPAPLTPTHLIQEQGKSGQPQNAIHFSRYNYNIFIAWIVSQAMGFWFSIKLILNLLRPTAKLARESSVYSSHIPGKLSLEYDGVTTDQKLQIGYTHDEMCEAVWQLLTNIGLIDNFAPVVYVVGHGASSVNNPHFAAYDCGACSGRAGNVNARAFAQMANNMAVREKLHSRGINIPMNTLFIAGLHDTTRDEIIFYDIALLNKDQLKLHNEHKKVFHKALDLNAKERSRRFASINSHLSPKKVHKQVIQRSISLFEPRPELNHATNALCIIGSRSLSKGVFLDRRAFLQSFNYKTDTTGEILANILKAVVPVCGGINLEYYFSKVDQNNLGAGTKLPYNIMGLFGVANGIDGDLRTGLPSQMIEIHDPIRMLFIIEHYPEIVLKSISDDPIIYQWFVNYWINLAVINPDTRQTFFFNNYKFEEYIPQKQKISTIDNIDELLENREDNLPVYLF